MEKKNLRNQILISSNENYSVLKNTIEKNSFKIEFIIKKLDSVLKRKGKIFICGNGGSAAEAQHLAAEFLVRLRPNINRKPLPLISLALDTSTITACANDYNFKEIFSRNLKALASKNDVLICLSTSGKSRNIIEVLKMSKKMGVFSISLLGNKKSLSEKLSNYFIKVESSNTARIQEVHLFLGHLILETVEKKFLKIIIFNLFKVISFEFLDMSHYILKF